MSALTAEIDLGSEAPTFLYRVYAEDKALLYVGITGNLRFRFAQHADTKEWWPEGTRRTVVTYPTRAEAMAAETAAIQGQNPVHNVSRPGVPKAARAPIPLRPFQNGFAIRCVREKHGRSEADVARALSMPVASLRRIETESESADLDVLARLADELTVPLAAIVRRAA